MICVCHCKGLISPTIIKFGIDISGPKFSFIYHITPNRILYALLYWRRRNSYETVLYISANTYSLWRQQSGWALCYLCDLRKTLEIQDNIYSTLLTICKVYNSTVHSKSDQLIGTNYEESLHYDCFIWLSDNFRTWIITLKVNARVCWVQTQTWSTCLIKAMIKAERG